MTSETKDKRSKSLPVNSNSGNIPAVPDPSTGISNSNNNSNNSNVSNSLSNSSQKASPRNTTLPVPQAAPQSISTLVSSSSTLASSSPPRAAEADSANKNRKLVVTNNNAKPLLIPEGAPIHQETGLRIIKQGALLRKRKNTVRRNWKK